MGRLQDKVALVTGGNTGIGRAVGLAFADEGADVVIGWHEREDDARSLAHAIEAKGRRAVTTALDVTDEASVRTALANAVEQLAGVDILVNGVAPGLVDTGFDPLSEEAKRAHAESLPLGRLGTVEDMTPAF